MFAVSRSAVFAVSLSVLGSVLIAQDGKTPPVPTPAPKAEKQGDKPIEKKETYAVVEAGHHMSAVADSAVEAMRKEKHAAFEAALAEFNKAKAAAEASKQPFDRKAPKEETIVVVKTGLASMADAEKAIAELKKAHEKPKDKPKDNPAPAPHGDGGKKKG
ncbi:MAG: hypothetical protein JNM25_00310 [Planctomycetes bacterium]|nr:hypothetical protein [Planctomycetota bacterium]